MSFAFKHKISSESWSCFVYTSHWSNDQFFRYHLLRLLSTISVIEAFSWHWRNCYSLSFIIGIQSFFSTWRWNDTGHLVSLWYHGKSSIENSRGSSIMFLFQPITVKYTERRQKFYTFLTSICAVVGGTFTVASIIDSLIFTASELFKKFEIGKLT